MELKTQVHAEDGKQELTITRQFDLPLELLFKAYMEPGNRINNGWEPSVEIGK
ncbi:MAG: hypothetical protein R2784_19905 [Saprospiraceae bacterium]